MGNCPNPYCEGTLVVTEYGGWVYDVSCDTCPFEGTDKGFDGIVQRLQEKALQEFKAQVAENGISHDIDDWDEWERRLLRNAQGFSSPVPWHGVILYQEYWESRGIKFEEK